jgi:hypothetical protein
MLQPPQPMRHQPPAPHNSVSNMPAAVTNACNVVAVTAAAALAAVPDLTVPTAGADAADATASAAFPIVAAAHTVVSVGIAAAGLSSAATTRFEDDAEGDATSSGIVEDVAPSQALAPMGDHNGVCKTGRVRKLPARLR